VRPAVTDSTDRPWSCAHVVTARMSAADAPKRLPNSSGVNQRWKSAEAGSCCAARSSRDRRGRAAAGGGRPSRTGGPDRRADVLGRGDLVRNVADDLPVNAAGTDGERRIGAENRYGDRE